MHLTTKGKYAVTAMLDMALQDPDKFVTIYQVANRQSIPAPYLEQLFRYLAKI
jgi:Rrf2 family iron-sulfur cluster assembly transcriptional regulator